MTIYFIIHKQSINIQNNEMHTKFIYWTNNRPSFLQLNMYDRKVQLDYFTVKSNAYNLYRVITFNDHCILSVVRRQKSIKNTYSHITDPWQLM